MQNLFSRYGLNWNSSILCTVREGEYYAFKNLYREVIQMDKSGQFLDFLKKLSTLTSLNE